MTPGAILLSLMSAFGGAADLSRFPPAADCKEALGFLDARIAWLDAQVGLHGDDPYWQKQYVPLIEDARVRRAAWQALANLRECREGEYSCVDGRGAAEWDRVLRSHAGGGYTFGVMPELIDRRYVWH